MTRFAPRLLVLFLCATALAGCATPDIAKVTGGKTAADAAKAQMAAVPTDLESSVRQAQLLRIAGQHEQAVRILSQLMLVASDDPRVVGEYGKTMVEQGRSAEAVQFLSRAIELQPNDWTVFSALGVAYDQIGNQPSARTAYEHALVLKPGEASVLSNYALSRMLANDPEGARLLIVRAQSAGGVSDPKIARNIALVNELAPTPEAPRAVAYVAPKPAQASVASSRPLPAMPIVIPPPPAVNIQPSTGPRQLMPQQQNVATMPRPMPQQQSSLYAPYQPVVMQRVPVDPLAGPVRRQPLPRAIAAVPHVPAKSADARTEDARPLPVKPVSSKTARNAVPSLRMTADARAP